MTTRMISCIVCTRFRGNKNGIYRCDAFPYGIPQIITTGQHMHLTPVEGDRGALFDPVDDDAREWIEDV